MNTQLPMALRLVDLSAPLAGIDDVAPYPWTRVIVLDGGALIGSTDIANHHAPVSATTLRDSIANALAVPLTQRSVARQLGLHSPSLLSKAVSVSIVIPTCNRPDDLRTCLTALAAERGDRPMEVIVVDNRPESGETRRIVAGFDDVHLIEERRPGLSYARNAGFAAANGEILIAIDDDVTVPRGWLERLLAPFADAQVMAVTGNVLPKELDTPAQRLFEAYGGLGKGFNSLRVDGDWFRSHRGAVPTWNLGATANAAFRAAIFTDPAIGMLDEALGAGMPTGCSEDTYLFYKILKSNHAIVYEPLAWVWHRHRRETAALRHQIYSYSKGHVAYHLITLRQDGDRRALIRLGFSLPKTWLRRSWQRIRRRSEYPLTLILVEIAGTVAGPWALWQSYRRVRRFGPGARRKAQHAVSMESPASQTPAA